VESTIGNSNDHPSDSVEDCEVPRIQNNLVLDIYVSRLITASHWLVLRVFSCLQSFVNHNQSDDGTIAA